MWVVIFFFKQKTSYEMRISDLSSDVCSSELVPAEEYDVQFGRSYEEFEVGATYKHWPGKTVTEFDDHMFCLLTMNHHPLHLDVNYAEETTQFGKNVVVGNYVYSILLGMSVPDISGKAIANRSEEHTSELQSLMRISYAVFCLQTKKQKKLKTNTNATT